jgi:cation:H+ antiporter
MLLNIFVLVAGTAFLLKGADWLVEGASALAKKHHVSDLAIGLTIVAFGTSMPEMVVNVFSSAEGHHDIVLGNIIGSNNFNLLAILGLTGLVVPIAVQNSTVFKEIPMSLLALLLFAAAAFFGLGASNSISRPEAIIMLLFFAGFLFYVFKQLKTEPREKREGEVELTQTKIWIFIALGLVGLVAGGKLVVYSATEIAHYLKVSEKIIGLTIVAAGTSLPELATSLVAAFKKNNDIAVGNVIGSNIFNLIFILPVSALVSPIAYNAAFDFDVLILGIGTVILLAFMFIGKKHLLQRWQALVLLLAYIAYTLYIIQLEVVPA